jgi:Na+-transporting methylmalonyl-CoA/oxaloacetate decarboxylase beta subunit
MGIIGGADGPTIIYVRNDLAGATLALLTSYFGLIIFTLIFCASLILFIVKRRTLKKWMKIVLLFLAIISFVFICFSVILAVLFGSGNAIVPVPIPV